MKTKRIIILISLLALCILLTIYDSECFPFRAGVTVSCALIVAATPRLRNYTWLVIAAYAMSVVGDWFMCHRYGITMRFVYGIAAFLTAHIGFMWFALKHGQLNKKVLICMLAPYLPFYAFLLFPHIESTVLSIAVLCYLLISCLSVASAAGIVTSQRLRVYYTVGIALLAFSDTIIAFREFINWHVLDSLVLPTYFACHVFVMIGFIHPISDRPTSVA